MLHHYPPADLPFKLINNYGPTEATVLVTSGEVAPTAQATTPPTIGRAIANTQIYILDEQLRQLPMDVPGELYIGGAGVAPGYLNRPELTEERFIANPFSSEPGARLYRTGDLARYLPDGEIAFMGRVDQQVKIRGYRIEPNEIVAVLDRQPGVSTSCVIAREDIPGEKRLVAYLVPSNGGVLSVAALQQALAERLPAYMIPATFVKLAALPLTANGKVDRAALPAPDPQNTLCDEILEEPTTPTEEQVAAIICSLLRLDALSIDDNIFMLGGHSLLGTQIIARIAETFGVDLSLRILFESPTVRQLAAVIEERVLEQIASLSEEEVRQLLG